MIDAYAIIEARSGCEKAFDDALADLYYDTGLHAWFAELAIYPVIGPRRRVHVNIAWKDAGGADVSAADADWITMWKARLEGLVASDVSFDRA